MDDTAIHNCYSALRKKHGWFQKENVDEKLRCMDIIHASLSPTNCISYFFPFLKNENILLRYKARDLIVSSFSRIPIVPQQEALKHIAITESDLKLFKNNFDDPTANVLLRIASFNRNGYVREYATKDLALRKDKSAIPYLLLRLNDWVPEVRNVALRAFRSFLRPENTTEVLENLPLVERLLLVRRIDLQSVHRETLEFIFQQAVINGNHDWLAGVSDKFRYVYYKNFLRYRGKDPLVVKQMARDRSSLVRSEALNQIQFLDEDLQKSLVESFLSDRVAILRLRALYFAKKFRPAFHTKIVELLSDISPSVRDLARILLKTEGVNFTGLYRERIAENKFIPGSLGGLAETGSETDLPVFEKFITNDDPKVLLPAITGVERFDFQRAKEIALTLVGRGNSLLQTKISAILTKDVKEEDLDRIREIFEAADLLTRSRILRLFAKIGGWAVLGDLFLSLTDNEEVIRESAWNFIKIWNYKRTTLFTSPSETEKNRILAAFQRLKEKGIPEVYQTVLGQIMFSV